MYIYILHVCLYYYYIQIQFYHQFETGVSNLHH